MRPIYVTADVPEPRWDSLEGCPARECAGTRDAPPAEMGAWYREHLGYLGWREVAPGTFRRGERELRLQFEAAGGGTAVKVEERYVP